MLSTRKSAVRPVKTRANVSSCLDAIFCLPVVARSNTRANLTVNWASPSSSSDTGTGGCTVFVVGDATTILSEEEVEELCVKMDDTRNTLWPRGGAVDPSSAARNVAAACRLALSIV